MILIFEINAQPAVQWSEMYGGSYDVHFDCVKQTPDGGFIVIGNRYWYTPYNSRDLYLLKTDSSGNDEWNQTYGGILEEAGNHIEITSDGGFIICGYTESYGVYEYRNVYLVKTDSNGDTIWTRTFIEGNTGYCVRQTSDGGYIVAGNVGSMSTYDFLLLKTDSNGDLEWYRTYGGENRETARSVIETLDGGYALVGSTNSFEARLDDVLLIKTDEFGNELWSRLYGLDNDDYGYDIKQTEDGDYLIFGTTYSYGFGSGDFLMIKTDVNGELLWFNSYGDVGSELGRSGIITSDDCYIIAGQTYPPATTTYDFYVVKVDQNGNQIWDLIIGNDSFEYGYCIQQTDDNGFIMTGDKYNYVTNSYNGFLVKLGPDSLAPLRIIVSPINPPFYIPASGGHIDFNVEIVNDGPTPVSFDLWSMVTTPRETVIGPIIYAENISLETGTSESREINQVIPPGAPSGTYCYSVYIGEYPNEILAQDSFGFVKFSTGENK